MSLDAGNHRDASQSSGDGLARLDSSNGVRKARVRAEVEFCAAEGPGSLISICFVLLRATLTGKISVNFSFISIVAVVSLSIVGSFHFLSLARHQADKSF